MNLKTTSNEFTITFFFIFFVQLVLGQLSFEGSEGIIYSPNYPDNYDNNENVVYTITVPVGHYIHLTLLDFATEDPYDNLEIFEGVGVNAVSKQVFAGDKTGEVLDIESSQATMVFTTDLTTTMRGFAVRFDMVQYGTVFMPTNSCPSPAHSGNFGIVTSPSFPANYPNNISCSYLLLAPDSHVISLQFVAFNTEDGYDIVTIYDGSNNSFPLIGRFSGNKIPPTITSTGNALFIFFDSDLVNNFPGFSGLYTSTVVGPDARRGVLPQILPTAAPRRDTKILKWLQDKKNEIINKTKSN